MFRPAVVVLTVLSVALATALFPFVRSGSVEYGHLAAFQDDFFYYLTVARNLAETGRSTFDLVSLTNGYHPLWMAVLVPLARLTDPRSPAFVACLQALVFVLTLGGGWLLFAITRVAFPEGRTAHYLAVTFFVFLYANLARTGMEVILTVPLMLASLQASLRFWRMPSARQFFFATATSTFTVLSRIDAVIFVLWLAATGIVVADRTTRLAAWRVVRGWRGLAAGLLGIAPLMVYLAINVWAFGALLPQNSAAKSMAAPGVNWQVLQFLFVIRPTIRDGLFFGLMATLPAVLVMVSALALPFVLKRLSHAGRLVFVATMGFAVQFYALLIVLTDWQLWVWYLYPLTVAAAVSIASLPSLLPVTDRVRRVAAAVAWPIMTGGVVILSAGATVTRHPASNPIHESALTLARFANGHPGRYAMGDRAGFAGFLLPGGLVQLEGLTSPRSLLSLIASRASLWTAFDQYGVDYYVTTVLPESGGCYFAEEPNATLAGRRSARMSARLCMAPVGVWTDRGGTVTQVFAVGHRPIPVEAEVR